MIYGSLQGIDLSLCQKIGKASTASESTSNGVCVSVGVTGMPPTSKLWIITKGGTMKKTKMPPVHPGEILMEEFLKPLGLTQYRVAKDIHVPPRRINEIIHGVRAISADTALRFYRSIQMFKIMLKFKEFCF